MDPWMGAVELGDQRLLRLQLVPGPPGPVDDLRHTGCVPTRPASVGEQKQDDGEQPVDQMGPIS